MQVMLMQPFPEFSLDGLHKTPPIEVGDTYNAVGEYEYKGRVYYILAEYGDKYAWRAAAFAILPDSSADEMADEVHEAIVNIETVPV